LAQRLQDKYSTTKDFPEYGEGEHAMSQRTSLPDELEETFAMRDVDHQRVKDLFQHYKDHSHPRRRQQMAAHVFVALELYALVEETVFYPAPEEIAPAGNTPVEDTQEERQRIRGLLAQLRACDPNDVGTHPCFQDLMDAISQHVS
jgi:hypothetical protein